MWRQTFSLSFPGPAWDPCRSDPGLQRCPPGRAPAPQGHSRAAGDTVCPTCCGPELQGHRRSGSAGSRPPRISFSRLTPGGSGLRGLAPCPAGPEQTPGSRHHPSCLFRPCGYSCLPAVSPVQAHREGSLFPLICLRCRGVPLLPDDSVPLEARLPVEHLGVSVSPAVTSRLSAPLQVTQGRVS